MNDMTESTTKKRDVSIEIDGQRRCNRPTRARGHCRQILGYPGDISCKIHAEPEDQEIVNAYRRGWDAAYDIGRERFTSGVQEGLRQAQHQAAQESARAEEAAKFRLEIDGNQIVCIGRYAYQWVGEGRLDIGDRVWVPGNWLFKEPSIKTVASFGSSYDGVLTRIARRAPVQAMA